MASNNQINVQLNFTANTAAAKKNIEGLQQTLTQLAVGNSALFKADATTAEIQKVSTAATELQYHLTKSLDASGTLNLKKFNASLKTAGANINQLSSSLLSAGSGGAQAFVQLSTAISQANVQTSKLNLLSNKFFKQLKRTAEFQISNTVYQMAINGLKNGYEYAQELNKSLNDIRIVSGQSAQQMADFAKQANKAAQALSSNTTAYTNAALIYYQQGLSDEQVVDRTNVTIKMANVTGDTAQTVSDQMTAIWNNFDDGSKSLEYYADVLTALGAATASSTDEIAEGVEKFAAIGKVTGLSYEYATAALATLVDRTRQSADTVGNSLKTIFSRLQGLSLGETLDDGLDLNKYSKALATVGVQILDVNGQMKDMDVILEDLASRWTTLDQGQKMALAQTVAGVRQYNNLISLMDNWDFMQQNLQVAYNSEGTITEQAEIYAESWEAAKNRTKAALEDIYQDLIDDKFFIQFQDFLTSIIQGVNKLVENIGGFKGVLLAVASIMATKIQPMATKLGQSLMMAFSSPQKIYAQNNKVFSDQITQLKQNGNWKNFSKAQQTQLTGDRKVANVRANYMASESSLNAQEREQAQFQINMIEMTVAHLTELAGAYDQIIAKRKEYLASMTSGTTQAIEGQQLSYDPANVLSKDAIGSMVGSTASRTNVGEKINNGFKDELANFSSALTGTETIDEFENKLTGLHTKLLEIAGDNETAKTAANNLIDTLRRKIEITGLNEYKQKIIDLTANLDVGEENVEEFNKALSDLKGASGVEQTSAAVDKLISVLANTNISGEQFSAILKQVGYDSSNIDNVSTLSDTAKAKIKQLAEETGNFDDKLKDTKFDHVPSMLEGFGQITSAIMNAKMALDQFKGGIESFQNGDTMSGVMSMAMGLTNATAALSNSVKGIQNFSKARKTFTEKMGEVSKLKEKLNAAKLAGTGVAEAEKKLAAGADEAAAAIGGTGGGLISKLVGMAGSMSAFIGGALAAIGIIAAVVVAIKALDQGIQTPKETTKDIDTALKGATETTKNAKNALDELKTSLDDIDKSYDAFDNLTVGTADFKQQIIDTNQQVIELLASIGKLDWSNIEIDDNGLYHIKKDVREDILKEAQDRSNTAQNFNNIMSAVNVRDDFAQSVSGAKGKIFSTLGHGENAIVKGKNNQAAFITELVKKVNADQNFLTQDNREALTKWVKSSGYVSKDADDEDINSLVSRLLTEKVVAQVNELSADYVSTLKESSVYMNNFVKMWQSDTVDALGNLGDTFITLLGEDIPDTVLDLYTNTYRAKWAGVSKDEARKAYAEAMGYDVSRTTKGGKEATYYKVGASDSEGITISDETVRYFMAVQEALKETGADLNVYKDLTETIGENDGNGLLQSILTNKNGGQADFGKIDEVETDYLDRLSQPQQEILTKAAGVDSVNALKEEIQQQQEQLNGKFNEIKNSFNDDLTNKLTGNVSFDTAEALSNLFNDFDLSGVSEVKETFSGMLMDLTKGLDDDQLNSFLTSFLQIDFSDWDAMDNVVALCQQFGISLDDADINTFATQFRAFGNALPISKFEELNSQVATLVDLLSKLKVGAKFSADEFAKIAENLENAEEYFVKIGDDYVQIKNIDANDLTPIDYGQMDNYQTVYDRIKNTASTFKVKGGADDGKSIEEVGGWGVWANNHEAGSEGVLRGTLQNLVKTGYLSDENLSLLGQDKDAFENLLSNNSSLEQLQAFFTKLDTIMMNGAAGNYDSSAAKQSLIATAGSVEKASNLEGFYDENGVATDEAINAMKVMATETERGRDALSEYQEEIKGVEKGTDKWNAATKKLEKTLRTIEADEVAKQTRSLIESLEDLTDEAEKQEVYAKLAEQLESIFGGDITAEWVKNNLDVIKAWQEGGDAAEAAAQKIELARKDMSPETWSDEASVATWAQETYEAFGITAEQSAQFANDIVNNGATIGQALANLDGSVIKIDGTADFTDIAKQCAEGKMRVEDLATAVQGAGMSHIQFALDGEYITPPPEVLEDPEAFVTWWNSNIAGRKDYSTLTATGEVFTDTPTPSMSSIGGKGGGGGGSSKKTKEKKPTDNKDRYHTVDQQLEDLSNQLDELGDAEDRAFGAEKIKTMAREMAKLNEQVAKYNDKLVEAQNYLTQDRAKAEDFASKIGMSIQYGSNGEILNWDELKKGYLDWYNAGVDKYNAGGIDDDAFSKQYDDVYSDAMDAFDQLEETNNLVQELKQNILDTQREYEDMYLAIQKEKLEINITIDENGMKLLEYFFDKLDDDLYDSVERMSILEDQVGNLIDQASAYEQNINNLLGTAGQWDGLNFNSYGLSLEDLPELLSKSNKELYEIFGGAGSNVQEIIDQLQNDYEKLLDTNKEITETRQKLIEEIGNSFEAWNSEIDEAEERLEDNASLMEHYRNVIDIVGRKTLGITSKFIKDYNIKQLDNDLAQLSASYAQLNKQREAVSALEQAIMRETSEETKALMQKELDDMRDALNEQVEDTAQKWEDCMRGIQEAYEDTVSVALDDWQTKMAGLSGSADMLQLSFDMATDIDDNYLDDYDKIYELSKLSADINNSIDDTDNIQSKEDLIALMEKVNELNESDADISQYTVDVLRARYELLKAEDALKEAQNAKSTVRLTQDNEGNWMYTYTTDQDAVSQAEQEYADKLHALEEVNQNYINDLDQKLADLTKSASEKINQIAQDSTLTLEEKKEKIQEVYEYTNEMERYLMEQTQLALEDAMEIYEVDAQKYSELTGNKMLDDEKWVNSFEEMKIAQITGFTELQDWDQQFSDSWDDTVSSLITTTDEFVEKNAEAFDTAKMDIKNASEEMGDDLNQIADDTNKVRDSIIDMGADAEQTIVSVIDYAKTWSDEWSTAIDAIISKNEQLAKSCDTIISKLADAQAANDMLNQQEAEEAQRQAEQANSNGSGSSGKGNYSGGGCGTCSSGCQGQTQSQTNTCVKSCSGSCQEWCGGSSCMGGCKSCSISCSKQCKTTTRGGCFAPDTKVLMADLTEKEIQYIELGDIVMSYDEKSQIFMPKKVTKIYPHYNTPEMIKINFQDDTFIELTPGHPILSQNGWRSLDILNSLLEHGVIAQELQYEDIILGYYNNYNIKLIQKLNIGNNYTSYNLEVEDYHTFITNGIVAHNKKVLYDHNANFTLDTGGYTGTFQYADTGMYTGQWANGSVRANGRLAFLHQKELVLNAHDTENFLQAVDIVRNLNESLDLGALSMSKGLGNITARGLDQNTVQTIDQNVSIKAEFPNVQDRNEIEEAFNNLINKASQYANRKNK